MATGDHIMVKRAGGIYYHHGIDMGDGSVIHFAGEPLRRKNAEVRRVSLAEFLQGGMMMTVAYPEESVVLTPDETVHLAESQLGTEGYSVLWNNCEHLAAFCKTGKSCSNQVRKYIKVAGTMAVVGVSTVGLALVTRILEKRTKQRRV